MGMFLACYYYYYYYFGNISGKIAENQMNKSRLFLALRFHVIRCL